MACAHSRGASCRRIVTASPGSITWLDAASSSGSAIDSNCSRSDDVLVADIVSGTGVRALENSPRLHHAADWRRGSSTSTPMTPARGPSTTSPLAPFDTPFLSSKKSVLARLLVGWLSRQCTDEQGTAAVFRVLPPSASSGVFAAERRHRAVSYLFAALRIFLAGFVVDGKPAFLPRSKGCARMQLYRLLALLVWLPASIYGRRLRIQTTSVPRRHPRVVMAVSKEDAESNARLLAALFTGEASDTGGGGVDLMPAIFNAVEEQQEKVPPLLTPPAPHTPRACRATARPTLGELHARTERDEACGACCDTGHRDLEPPAARLRRGRQSAAAALRVRGHVESKAPTLRSA